MFRYLSLFSGIGGFEVGIRKIFPDAQCAGFSEVNEDAIQVYRHHFPNHPYLGPIQEVRGHHNVQLIVGGSPCKDLSQLQQLPTKGYNKTQQGLKGKHSKIFYDFLRVVKENWPCRFILENVAGMPDKDKDEISRCLNCEPIMLDSKFVSGQRRRRLFWCNFPIEPFTKQHLFQSPTFKSVLIPVEQITPDLRVDHYKTFETYQDRIQNNLRVSGYYSVSNSEKPKSCTMTTNYRTWMKDQRPGMPFASGFRKIHPVEAERLQGFPDGWTLEHKHKIHMKLIGNAVNTDVVAHVCKCLQNYWTEHGNP